ncbi:MAG: DUF2867 domain-containing protein [Flavobacteriales bacterium]|jgi:hypothetical protein|nr:DUF2867 domain-containing protein [Flavobacteriales bacterium]
MVKKEKIELSEKLLELLDGIDFYDTFSTTNHQDTIEEVGLKIFNTSPKWVEWLFNLRNFLVRFIGLKTDPPKDFNESLEEGGYIHFFKIYQLEPDFMVLGADDKHLNFRAVIAKHPILDYNIKVTTLVTYNNRLGHIYFFLIRPFHALVVRQMVKQAYTK